MSGHRRGRRDGGASFAHSNKTLSPREMRLATKQIARMEKGATQESPVDGDHQARDAEEGRTMTSLVKTQDGGDTGEVCDLSQVVGCYVVLGRNVVGIACIARAAIMSWMCCQLLHRAYCHTPASL